MSPEVRILKTITIAIQKGGTGKTTSAAVIGYLLALDRKVLLLDMDQQGNLTELCLQTPIRQFRGMNVSDVLKSGDPRPHILEVTQNNKGFLHILPGSDTLGAFERSENYTAVAQMLAPIRDYYDYVIIDTPPALGTTLIASLKASDYIIPICETAQFCYMALQTLLQTVKAVEKDGKPELLGVLPSLLDSRRKDNQDYLDMLRQNYPCFKTVIKRRAALGRLPYLGFAANPELSNALEPYRTLVPEIKEKTHD